MKILPEPITFEWDKGNIDKNFIKHKVSNKETEEIFISGQKFIFEDERHSFVEKRYMLLGKTNTGRRLAIFFTIRNQKIRIISARDMHIKERGEYEKNLKTNS
jgi:uncharacterized DUF497 family protein